MTTFDCPLVIVPGLPEADRSSATEVRRVVIEMAGYARALATRKIRFGYHNHAFEFAPLNGSSAWDILVAGLPAEVELELDVFWLSFAGRDPVAEIQAVADRVRLLHMKDRVMEAEPHDAPLGEGALELRKIVTAGRKAGVDWYVVEQDQPADPLANVETSLRYLRALATRDQGTGAVK
jgi:sugar phosphate isomerase/epimerase